MLSRSAASLAKSKSTATLPQEESTQNEIIHLDDFEAPHYNLKYYETVPISELKALADRAGISECKDLDLALPYLKKAKNVLEIGGGYGRALDYALKHQLKAHFDVLEPAKQFYAELVCNYMSETTAKRFSILPAYIEEFHTDRQYEVVLWLWSQINELKPAQIEACLCHLKTMLRPNGVVCIETFDFQANPSTLKYRNEDYYFVDMKYQILMISILTSSLIEKIAKKAGFKKISFIPYSLSKGFKRIFMLLEA